MGFPSKELKGFSYAPSGRGCRGPQWRALKGAQHNIKACLREPLVI